MENTFMVTAHGPNATWAFRRATNSFADEDYLRMRGKESFISVPLCEGDDPFEYASRLIANKDKRILSKDGPCGCINITDTTHGLLRDCESGEGVYLFFGYVS